MDNMIIRKWEGGQAVYLVPSKSKSRRFYEVWYSYSLKNPGWKCHCEFVSLHPEKVCRHIKLVETYMKHLPSMIIDNE